MNKITINFPNSINAGVKNISLDSEIKFDMFADEYREYYHNLTLTISKDNKGLRYLKDWYDISWNNESGRKITSG